ncbi:hypothetical protein FEM48_Zijuj08G0199600 [Ziziphus jujuba var. spinosa]|uniref:Rapid ALkalinization Factor n=1 Tax=Ziziphus jujuba var. spinosa TaxID=714518 RepID=A0A978V130_ZIZJJ|nr:hypothetical protein FEM48_Zijuj08G0199600 [Ziziphus jujuba var. spinosa]
MATLKASFSINVLCIASLICFIFLNRVLVNATPIGYPPIGKGDPTPCPPTGCLPPTQGPYSRGCTKPERCRGSPPDLGRKLKWQPSIEVAS